MDGILAVTPYYNRPSQAGLEAHFRQVAAACNLPVILYDIPGRTGRKIDTATILRLAEDVPTIVGVKDAAGNPAETARLIDAAPEGFEVYSGDDALNLAFLAVGAVGVISVAAHWTAALHREMVDAVFKGDMDTARAVNDRLLVDAFESSDARPNPVPPRPCSGCWVMRWGSAASLWGRRRMVWRTRLVAWPPSSTCLRPDRPAPDERR